MTKKYVLMPLILTLYIFLINGAHASVQIVETTGDVNLRREPALNGAVLESVPVNTKLEYRDLVSQDSRGVDWYAVWFDNQEAWVSSRFAELYPVVEGNAITRHQLFEQLGVLSPADTVKVESYSAEKTGNLVNLHIVFEDDVYGGGTEGYEENWLTGNGVAAEVDVDLDGDGVKELLLIHCTQQESGHYYEKNWKGLIYEPAEYGYVKAAEFPLDILSNGTCERWVRLLKRDGRTMIAVIRNDEWDGTAGEGVGVSLFDYNGETVTVDILASISFAESYIAVGPLSLDWLEEQKDDELQWLLKSTSLFYFKCSDHVEYYNDAGGIIRQECLDNMTAMLEYIRKYDIDINYTAGPNEYDIQVGKGGTDILWARETCPYPDPSYLDLALYTNLDHGLGNS